ncbi:hypothetical protein CCH79_00019275, partial [Gambusia affinis]
MFSKSKSHCTVKGLIGMALHGLANFLTEDMAIMVDKGFLISDYTQKITHLLVAIELVSQRVKENKLFDSVIPLSIVVTINGLFAVAFLLINYQNKPL